MWNRVNDLQTGKQLTLEEFERCVGHTPEVKELMRSEHITSDSRKLVPANSYISKSLRMSKKRGVSMLKNIKGVAHSINLRGEKEKDVLMLQDAKASKNGSNDWVKVRTIGKSFTELSALHLCQEFQAHEGSIWTIKFSSDTHFLASAGEDKVIHVWEVQECEIMSMNEGNLTPLHPSFCNSPDGALHEKKKKGKSPGSKKGHQVPDYVHVPETVFSLSEKPICSFKGHQDDVLDLSWSRSQQLLSSSMDKTVRLWELETKSCIKMFAHNDYVTCIHFNPMDDDYFISGSLDAKVRIWSIPGRHVVDWTDLHEMVTAACYSPDGQAAFIGSHKGACRMYTLEGFRNTSSQMAASYMYGNEKIVGIQAQGKKVGLVQQLMSISRVKTYQWQFHGLLANTGRKPWTSTPQERATAPPEEKPQQCRWGRRFRRRCSYFSV